MEQKLIDKEQAYQVLSEYYHHTAAIQHKALREALDRVPVVDAVPVRHGEWEIHVQERTLDIWYRCSKCKSGYRIQYNFCPNCGAKMYGKQEKQNDR